MKKSLWLKITIVLIGFVCMADMVVIPAANDIFSSFPNANSMLLNFFLTGTLLFSVVGSLSCGFLARFISKKYLLIVGYIVFIIGACGGGLINSMYYMTVMRALVGFAYGIVGTGAMGLISELFIQEKERSSIIGIYNGVMAASGAVMSSIAGALAVVSWHNVFYVYWAAVPILILMIIFLPKTPPEGKSSSDEVTAKEDKIPILKFGAMVVACFLFNALYMVVLYFISIYLAETHLGDAATAGIASSAATIGSCCACIIFSFVYQRFKRGTPIIFFLICAIAYIVLAFPSNVWIVATMCLFSGAAYGFGLSYYLMSTSIIAPTHAVSMAMAITTSCLNLGGFFSAYTLNIYKIIFHAHTMRSTFLYIGITLAIGGVISIMLTIREKNMSTNVKTIEA